MEELSKLEPHIRITITNPQSESHSAFGRGVAELCLGVRETGSLNASAKSMHMAYSKAWRVLKDTEEALGIILLDRNGAHGSTLTAEGNKLLDAYLDLDTQISAIARETFKNALGSVLD